MRIAIVCPDDGRRAGAIGAHARVLAAALAAKGHDVDVRGNEPLFDRLRGHDAVVVEYNPFLYGRRGVAPRLVLELLHTRFGRGRPRIVLVVHEPFVEGRRLRELVLGGWQRMQLFALRVAADVVLPSIAAWTVRFGRWWPRRPTFHLPSGSTLPDARAKRAPARAALGLSDVFVVATLSSGHPSHLDAFVSAALAEVSRVRQTVLLALGDRAAPDSAAGVEVRAPGRLADEELARLLAVADLYLSPLVDGVSTRRTSVMAALQQGIAVVGTRGPLTDSELADSDALALAPASDAAAFAALAARLASDDLARAGLAARGRDLYERRYAPSLLADIVLEACGA